MAQKHCRKFQQPKQGARTLQTTDDRRQTDRQTDGRRHIANMNMSSRSLKTNGCHIRILLPVSTLIYLLSSASHFASGYEISSQSNHPRRCYDVTSILKMAAIEVEVYSGLRFQWWQWHSFEEVEISRQTKFRYLNPQPRYNYFRFPKRMAVILKLYFRLRFYPIFIIGVSFCIGLSNFILNEPYTAE